MSDLEVVHQATYRVYEFGKRDRLARCGDCKALVDHNTQDMMDHTVWHVTAHNARRTIKPPPPDLNTFGRAEVHVQVLCRTSDNYHYAQIVK